MFLDVMFYKEIYIIQIFIIPIVSMTLTLTFGLQLYLSTHRLCDREKIENLEAMCKKFEVPMMNQKTWVNKKKERVAVKMNLALGFPPNSRYSRVQEGGFEGFLKNRL